MSSDDSIRRKKLSLKGKRVPGIAKNYDSNTKIQQKNINSMLDWEREVYYLREKIKEFEKKISQIDQRLIFGYSEALKESAVKLTAEVVKIEAQITEILINNL